MRVASGHVTCVGLTHRGRAYLHKKATQPKGLSGNRIEVMLCSLFIGFALHLFRVLFPVQELRLHLPTAALYMLSALARIDVRRLACFAIAFAVVLSKAESVSPSAVKQRRGLFLR